MADTLAKEKIATDEYRPATYTSRVAVILRQIPAFTAKAKAAAQTLGFSSYTLREIHIQQAQLEGGNNQPRPMMMARAMAADAAPVQIEAGRTAINLTVSGSIQLK